MQQNVFSQQVAEHTQTHTHHPLVLVVEDYVATQHVISYMLSLQGYQPVCVANGQEALEWIADALARQEYPSAILLDLLMPVMNGIQFLNLLRDRWTAPVPLPPTILLTVDQGNYDYLHCTDVLQKPFHIKDLLEKLARLSSTELNTPVPETN